MPQVLNPQDHPRVLLIVEDDGLREEIRSIANWGGSMEEHAEIPSIAWPEHDVVITDFSPYRSFASHLPMQRWIADGVPVFYIVTPGRDGETVDRGLERKNRGAGTLVKATSPGRQVAIEEEDLPADEAALARSALSADLSNRPSQWGLSMLESFSQPPCLVITPLLLGPKRMALAGVYDRGDGVTNWFMPRDASLLPWLRLAFARWGRERPQSFPSAPEWQHSPEWQSKAEENAASTIRSAVEALGAAQAEHDRVVAEATAELVEARSIADRGQRRLLTASGAELVAAVADALRLFGLDVLPMDDDTSDAPKHEDLQASTSSSTAIVEVTGTKRGVPQLKWTKLATHLANYLRQQDADERAVPWLVVNQHLELEPQMRPHLWNPDFVAIIEESGGMAIESPALFVLAEALAQAQVSADEVRTLLFETRGVLDLQGARQFLARQIEANPSTS